MLLGLGVDNSDGVKEVFVLKREANFCQNFGKGRGLVVDLLSDCLEVLRSVVDRIHSSHDCQQHLGGANVAGCLLAPNVLLSGLQGEAIGR